MPNVALFPNNFNINNVFTTVTKTYRSQYSVYFVCNQRVSSAFFFKEKMKMNMKQYTKLNFLTLSHIGMNLSCPIK